MPVDPQLVIQRLLDSRVAHHPTHPLSEDGGPAGALSIEDAYQIQETLRRTLETRGELTVGWKAAFTAQAARQTFKVSEPVSGFLLASGVYASGDEVPIGRFAQLGVEAEIAFLLRSDLRGPGVTPGSALLALAGALPALELIDVRFTGHPKAADVVADGAYANAIVLGQPLTPVAFDLALEGVVYELNGRVMATNTAAEVMGNPLASLVWLANHLGRRGLHLEAGQVVMSGSISQILWPKAGDEVRATFTRLGSVAARFV